MPVSGRHVASGEAIDGYEIHLGRTDGPDCARPRRRCWAGGPTAPRRRTGWSPGTYVHGLFGSDGFRSAFLAEAGVASALAYEASVEATLDGLADHLERHVAIDRLLAIAGLGPDEDDGSRRRHDQHEEDRVGDEVDRQRPADVGRVWRRAGPLALMNGSLTMMPA